MKKKKILLAIFSLVALCSCSFLEGANLYKDLDNYELYKSKLPNAKEFMPELDTLTNYDNINLYFWYDDYLESGNLNLKVLYSEEQYEEEKIKVLDTYQFLNTPIKGSSVGKFYNVPEVKFDYREYYFQVVDNQKFDYYHCFGMIAYSDSLKEICYLYHYYTDGLTIGTFEGGMQGFVKSLYRFDKTCK